MTNRPDQERSFANDRWVRNMCDYSVDGVWGRVLSKSEWMLETLKRRQAELVGTIETLWRPR